tara:strand:+ start:2230 stop:5232 length:3003 start_codon:yes stop_codon:yes gene_type:complete
MYSKKINQLATNLNPQSSDLIPIGDATTGQLKTTTFGTIFGTSADGIISGGVVTWSGTGLLFNVSSCQYSLNGIRYTTAATTITLTAADPTNARIDVIAVNTSSAVVLITGTPSANPVEPQVDPATQIQLTNITVNAGSATPNISSELIYDENVETWTKTNNGLTSINYASTIDPYVGTKSILATFSGIEQGKYIRFTPPTPLNSRNYSVLKFAIKLSRPLVSQFEGVHANLRVSETNYGLQWIWMHGSPEANNVAGFNYTSTSWQLISVPIAQTFTFFSLDFIVSSENSPLTINIDRIELQNINNQLPTSGISIGDKVNNSTTGSVLFSGSGGALSQDNTNFYWDDTNNRLGLGNNTPSFTLDVSGTGRVTGNLTASSLIKSGGTASQILAANGSVITAGTNITISGGTISANDTDTGITSLNGLTALTQTFATGSSGTDFNISSATSTHTFNIPTASATNRGALSSADWTTFNSKQNAITLTTTGTSGAATLVGATLNIPQYQSVLTNPVTGTGTINELTYWTSSSAIGSLTTATYPSLTELSYVKGVTSAIQTQLNAKQGTLTLTTTGTSGAATLIGNTLNIPQYGGGMAIGGSITSATAGSVLFAGTSGVLQQDNANFFWDDANNRLGIGTASPSNDITLSKNQNASTNILVSNTTSGTASQIQLILTSDATAGSGNLSKKSNTFTTSGIINLADLVLQNSTKGDIAILNDFASGTIKFAAGASSTAQMTLTAEGRLGIGTTTFTYAAANRGLLGLNGTTDSLFEFKNNNSTAAFIWANSNYFEIGALGSRYINFVTNGNERMRLNSNGYLKVSNDGSNLPSADNTHEFKNTNNSDSFRITSSSTTYNGTIIQVNSNRNTTNNSYYYFQCFNAATATNKLLIADSGNITNTNNSYGQISDIKLKENILDANNKLYDLLKVRIVNFNFKNDTQKQIGVIAQELEQVFPSMIETYIDKDENGNDLGTVTKSVKYSVFVPIIIKAIQELKAEIEILKNK